MSMVNGQRRLYEFGKFRVDSEERLLLRNGEAVPLPPRVFDTLLLLVRNSGRALDKDALMKELWPDTFVEEVNLAQHISLLRKRSAKSRRSPSTSRQSRGEATGSSPRWPRSWTGVPSGTRLSLSPEI